METSSLNGTTLTHRTANLNGIDLHYVTAGHGEPVFLWHGFLGTWYTWRKVIPLLADNYTVIAPDMRGYGDSAKPSSGYDGATLFEDMRQLAKRLALGPMHVVAHDMGAPPALLWAAHHPDEVKTLAYLDEPVLTDDCLGPIMRFSPDIARNGGLWWWAFAFATDMPERLIVGKEREFLSWFTANYSASPQASDGDALSEYLRTFSGADGVRGAFGVYRAVFDTMSQTEPLKTSRVHTPVFGLGGKKSIGDGSFQMLQTVAAHVQGGALENCGHFIPEEQPEELVRRLRDFWRSAA